MKTALLIALTCLSMATAQAQTWYSLCPCCPPPSPSPITPTPTPKPTPTPTATWTQTPTPSPSATPSVTPSPTSTPSPTPKPFPAGIIALLKGSVSTDVAWGHPIADGGRYRGIWLDIQKSSATAFDWSTTDEAVAKAKESKKFIGISLSAGCNTPGWVYAIPGVTKFKLEASSVNGDGNTPLPWEKAYQDPLIKFIYAFGAKYDSNPTVSYVVVSGFQQMIETRLVTTQGDYDKVNVLAKAAGYADAHAAYIAGAETIITAWVKAFPNTAVMITTASSFLPTPTDIQTVRKWGQATYPKHFGTMTASLRATLPPHALPPPPPPFPNGRQFIYNAANPLTYMPPAPNPIPKAPQPLQDGLEEAVSEGAQFVEVYEIDLTDAASQSVLAAERIKLKANIAK